jgi:hypothetical protein
VADEDKHFWDAIRRQLIQSGFSEKKATALVDMLMTQLVNKADFNRGLDDLGAKLRLEIRNDLVEHERRQKESSTLQIRENVSNALHSQTKWLIGAIVLIVPFIAGMLKLLDKVL